MTAPQITVLVVLAATVATFLWGRWRHDMVAMGAPLACVAAGLVPGEQAFAGFGHPAVITVACVLVISRALQTSGAAAALDRSLPAVVRVPWRPSSARSASSCCAAPPAAWR